MANGFAIRISAVDGASRQIDLINRKLMAMRAPVDRLRGSLAKLGNVSGVSALTAGIGRLARAGIGAARSIASIIPGLGAITGAATIGGMYALVSAWGGFGTRLQQNAGLLRVSTDRLHAMRGAAALLGSDAESMSSGLTTLGGNIQDGIAGRAPEFVQRMTEMGISLRNADGSARNAAEVFDDIQRVMSHYRDPMVRAQTANELFGGSADALLPILSATTAQYRAAQAEARSYGVVTAESAARADQFRRSQVAIRLALAGIGETIATRLGPHLTKLSEDFSKWLISVQPQITDLADRFVKWLDSITRDDVKKFLDDLHKQIDTILTVSKALLALWVGSQVLTAVAAVASLARGVGLLASASTLASVGKLLVLIGRFAGPWALLAGAIATLTQLEPVTPEQQQERRDNWRNRATGAGGTSPAAPQTADRQERENAIYDGLVSRGVPADEAAGVTSNGMRESGGRIDAFNPAGGGIGAHGVFQNRGARARMADGRLVSQGTLDEQLDHFMRERAGSERANIERAARGAQDAGDWGVAYSRGFERHGDENEDAARGQEALRIQRRQNLRRLQNPPAAAPGVTPPRGVDAVTQPRPQQQSSLTGNARLEVAFANAPAGTTARAQTSGNIFSGAPNISMGMPSYASA